jgi:hypothetical protein
MKSMPFFERNSFVLRQLLQPGWVNRINLSATLSMILSSTANYDVAPSSATLASKLIISSSTSRRNLLESRSNTRRLSPRIQLFQETALVEIVEKAMIDKLFGLRAFGGRNRLREILQGVLHTQHIDVGRFL